MISSKKHDYAITMADIKVGDVLTVRSMDWYEQNQTNGSVHCTGCYWGFVRDMSQFCGCKLKVRQVDTYTTNMFPRILTEEVGRFAWEPWMFEECEFPNG